MDEGGKRLLDIMETHGLNAVNTMFEPSHGKQHMWKGKPCDRGRRRTKGKPRKHNNATYMPRGFRKGTAPYQSLAVLSAQRLTEKQQFGRHIPPRKSSQCLSGPPKQSA